MRILGVDPGGTGALALLTEQGRVLEVHDMPVFRVSRGKGTKAELNVHELAALLQRLAPDVCFFERVAAMEGDGTSAAFNFGEITGACRALCVVTGARFERVTPPEWKRALRLIGKAKDDSRARACELWPANAPDFRLKKHDGRADAALIAEFGRRRMLDQGIFG